MFIPVWFPFAVEQIDAAAVPQTHTKIMLTVGDPGQAFKFALIPNGGVGLARTEFIITNHIGIHPMALCRFPKLQDRDAIEEIRKRIGNEDAREFFIRRFSEGVGRIAAAFYPKPVIVRTSDFKTNEYARLIGGKEFERRKRIRCSGSAAHRDTIIPAMPKDLLWSARRWRV